jgi:hypothetical protein
MGEMGPCHVSHVIIIVLARDIPPCPRPTLSLSRHLSRHGREGWVVGHSTMLSTSYSTYSLCATSTAKALAGHLFSLSRHPIEKAMSKYLVRL